ncbi:MAG TPA: DNA methyltransferase [Candidatus Acidoferrales bacterium]|nr:DNA methyltransferase [Candidatus Acidoferrales bacterium]
MVQEFLNRSESLLWGVVTNGLRFRLLRDSVRTARPTYLEFDLETILEGVHYNEFVLFYRLCHRTRLPQAGRPSEDCWLEKYYQLSVEKGGRVRDNLRDGVEEALKVLGTGFLRHPENTALLEKIDSGKLSADQYHRQLLLLVYRLLFLTVAEDRHLVISIGESAVRNQAIYQDNYSMGKLRERAEGLLEDSGFSDLWVGLMQTFKLFADSNDTNPLGIPPLNGDLFSHTTIPDLETAQLSNPDLLKAIRWLMFYRERNVRQRVNYAALDVEELGSVYESLLDFRPVVSKEPDGRKFELGVGGERKTTGSYYTRPELVRELIQSALIPVLENRLAEVEKQANGQPAETIRDAKARAIQAISVCDPACGSGHFLLEAARRLGKELARIRVGEDEPTPEQFHVAVRDVISHCIYGVDQNPLAVDLCKLALWLEGHWAGKPLSFLDHRIRCGNSLIGVLDPTVMADGIPDDAFNPVAGDDKKVAAVYKRRNKAEKALGQKRLEFEQSPAEHSEEYAELFGIGLGFPEDKPSDVRKKAELFAKARVGVDWWHDYTAANLWTASFFLPLTKLDDPLIPTQDTFLSYLLHRQDRPQMTGMANSLAGERRFFHWRLEFPEVFTRGGFDVILGNPPWERTALEELEFFASRSPAVLSATTTALRKQVIRSLRQEMPTLFSEYAQEKRRADAENKFFIESGSYPLGAQGRLNTYALFANLGLRIVSSKGRLGMVLQTGLATDAPMEEFWRFLIRERRLVTFVDFENKKRIFRDVHPEQKFALVTMTGDSQPKDKRVRVGFWLQQISELSDPEKVYEFDTEDLVLFSPNTGQPLLTRRRSDLEVLRRIYSCSDVCWRLQSNSGRARAWVSMTSASFSEFCQRETDLKGASQLPDLQLRIGDTIYSPLLEAKLIEQYDFSYATYAGTSEGEIAAGNPRETIHADGDLLTLPKPRYWADKRVVDDFLIPKNGKRGWCFGYRDVTNVNNERTTIATVLPAIGFLQPLNGISCSNARTAAVVLASVNSMVSDFVARSRFTGRHLNVTTFSQLPIPKWIDEEFVVSRVVELTYTGNGLKDFAMECGYSGEPFPWNSGRRQLLKHELDAAFAHFYGLTADDLAHVLATFTVLRSREEREYGSFLTRDTLLRLYEVVACSLVPDH